MRSIDFRGTFLVRPVAATLNGSSDPRRLDERCLGSEVRTHPVDLMLQEPLVRPPRLDRKSVV